MLAGRPALVPDRIAYTSASLQVRLVTETAKGLWAAQLGLVSRLEQ